MVTLSKAYGQQGCQIHRTGCQINKFLAKGSDTCAVLALASLYLKVFLQAENGFSQRPLGVNMRTKHFLLRKER